MFQPDKIKNVTFEQSVFSGYKKENVDDFLDEVYEEYSRLYKENAELVQKLKVCVAKIDEYRQDEQFLKSAIINAQKLNENSIKEIEAKKKETELASQKQSEAIISESQKEADELLSNAKLQAETILSQSKEESENLLSDAKNEASAILDNANSEAERIRNESEADIAEYRERTAKEFERQKEENDRLFEQQKVQYQQQIASQQEKLDKIKKDVVAFKESVLAIYKQQTELLGSLPSDGELSDEANDILPTINEEINDLEEENLIESSDTETIDEEFAEAENDPIQREIYISSDESITIEEDEYLKNEVDLKEIIGIPGSDDVFLMDDDSENSVSEPVVEEQEESVIYHEIGDTDDDTITFTKINQDDPISEDAIIVNPDIAEEEMQESLFSGSPLIFPDDIPEDSQPTDTEQSSAKYKNLKFGVDFDVKKDK